MERTGPVRGMLMFVAMAYAWTWALWFPAGAMYAEPSNLSTAMMVLGGFGPALAGIATLRIIDRERRDVSLKGAALGFAIGGLLAAAAFGLMHYSSSQDGWGIYTERLPLDLSSERNWLVWALIALSVASSGFIFASVGSRALALSRHFAGLLPSTRSLVLLPLVLLFLPAIYVSANLIDRALGGSASPAAYETAPVAALTLAFGVKLVIVCLLTGGNEEHGWRAVLQPLLQKKTNPLIAAALIGLVWELWHLPLTLAGFYGEGPIAAILTTRLLFVLLFSIVLAIIYNGSHGSVFLCVVWHGCMNSQAQIFAASSWAWLTASVAIIALLVATRPWRRSFAYHPVSAAR